MTAPEFSAREKLQEIEREIKFRHRVYSRAVHNGKMKLADAQRKLRLMTAIAEDYRRLIAAEPDLFNRSSFHG
ncbi:hypothetical protein [Pararhizobium haloflavum]|uniref:hypothetical protein n=1 Tax=Pararhizobium haloflavum TaxID=2037914 RepID=UPI000C174261|nr:hypothetical protein [Pararhizobium haloflavum]